MRKVVLLALLLCLFVAPALGAPLDLALAVEFAAGTLGGYAAGSLGAVILSSAFAVGCQGWECLGRTILGAVVGFGTGSILGSSVGVIATASLFGAEGNVALCFLGATAGTGAMLGISIAFEATDRILPLAPAVAAFSAVAGFNLGAAGTQ